MNKHEKTIDRFRRDLVTLLALKYSVAGLTLWAFLWGSVVLVLRATAGTPRLPLYWGLAGLPLVLVPAILLARRQIPSLAAVRALLDRDNGYGGVLMAAAERPLGQWRGSLPEPGRPRLRWRGKRPLTLLAAAVGFLTISFLVPERFAAYGGNRLEVGNEVAKLTKQIEVLKEEKILDAERAGNLQEKLEQVRDESSGEDPAKTLEALDSVGKTVKEKAKEAAEQAVQKTEKMTQAEALAEAMRLQKKKRREGKALGEKAKKEAMEELARLAREAAKQNEALRDALKEMGLDQETLEAMQGQTLSDEELKKLADALRDAKGNLKKMVAKLEKARLIDPDKLKQCEACGQCDGEGLAKFLKENEGKCSVGECLARWAKDKPGRGGITRGPGAADLTFGKPSEELKAQLKEETLTPSELTDLKESKLKGVGFSAPKVEDGAGRPDSGALAGSQAGGGSAHTQVVLPRHRGPVERFFERPDRP